MSRTVKVDEDVFIDMIWDRINNTKWGDTYSEEFWTEVIDYLSDGDWFGDSQYNNPSYIVDNIAINGEICEIDECADNYDAINDKYDGDVEAWAEDKGYLIFDDYVVINLGF